jgi:hypothetical protein
MSAKFMESLEKYPEIFVRLADERCRRDVDNYLYRKNVEIDGGFLVNRYLIRYGMAFGVFGRTPKKGSFACPYPLSRRCVDTKNRRAYSQGVPPAS